VGWRIRGSLTCPLAADRGEKWRAIYVYISFLHAVVVVLVVSIIILIYFVVVIFSLHVCIVYWIDKPNPYQSHPA